MINQANDSPQDSFTQKDKVKILFHEYDTLRTEVIHRINNGYQLIAGVTGLLIWLVSHAGVNWRFCILLGISVAVVLVLWRGIYQDIKTIARRLRELENEINKLAGETLLVWETRWSPTVVGRFAYYLCGTAPSNSR
jgi:hypothetical protein